MGLLYPRVRLVEQRNHLSISLLAVRPAAERDWYTTPEIAAKYHKSQPAVREAGDSGRLPVTKVPRGTRTEWRFPKSGIDAISAWPHARAVVDTDDEDLRAAIRRLVADNERLHADLESARTGWALAEHRISQLELEVTRRTEAIRALLDDHLDPSRGR